MSRSEDTPEPYVASVDRRTTLGWLGAAGALGPTVAPNFARAQSPNDRGEKPDETLRKPPATGYGTDPVLVSPKPAPWPRLMTPSQLQTAALLCDFILPASADAPSATALKVPDFLDEWISAPYPQQTTDRPIILGGLDALEAEARRRFGKGLLELGSADRTGMFTPLTTRSSNSTGSEPHVFFRRFRSLTIGGYYTTPAGFKDIGYIGNVARAVDPGPSPAVVAAVDGALKGLGL